MHFRHLTLHAILEDGTCEDPIPNLPIETEEVFTAYKQLYKKEGLVKPWIGYLAVADQQCVGTCGFKSLPQLGRVEIAYYTFPAFEGKKVATIMAEELCRIAHRADPSLTVFAYTLPEENASTAILRKLGFRKLGEVDHPEDGIVWEWEE